MKARPLIPVLVCLVSGILLARFAPVALFGLAALSLLGLAAPKSWRGAACAGLVISLAGCLVYTARYAILPGDLRARFADTENLVTLRGKLLEAPLVRAYPSRGKTNYSTTAPMEVSAVRVGGEWHNARGVVMSSSSGILAQKFRPGAEVEVAGVLRPPPGAVADGLFDYREYLYHQRIFYQLRTDAGADWELVRTPARSFTVFTDRFQRWAQQQLARGLPEDQILDLIRAMTLGWKTGLDGTVADAFMRTGTMHIFAISGLHVACIAGVLVHALRFCGFTRQHCGWIAIPLLWFYTLATGWQSTAVRSALMSTVLILGWGMKRPTDLLNSTAAAGLLILVFEPEQLFQASFQLSFLVVFSMGLFLPALETVRARALAAAKDPFLPPELRPKWKQLLDRPIRMVTTSFAVSFASWIGSLPLVAWYFNITTPISLLANLLAVPLSSLALTTSLLSLAVPPLGPFFNFLSYAYMWETVVVTHWFAAFDWGYFHVPKPTPLFFLLFYSLVLFLFAWPKMSPRIRLLFGAVPTSLALAFLVSLTPATRTVRATMLPINGTPVHFDFPGRGRDLLIDCSSERDSDFVLKRYLRAQGVGTIANLLVTHGDVNHAGGYELVWREFTPRMVFTSSARARSPSYRRMIDELDRGFLEWTKVQRGDELAGWEVLHPTERTFSRADDNSVVLRATIHGWRILFLSELGRAGQRELARSGLDLAADIVLCGAPEQDEPIEADILAAINPRLILVGNTAGFVNAGAESRLVSRLRKTGVPVFTTTRHGALSLALTRGTCAVQTGSGQALELVQ